MDQMSFPSPFLWWNSWTLCCQMLEMKLLLYLQIW